MKIRQERGRAGEDLAVQHLQAHGYRVIVRNWRAGNSLRGEVDCIAWQGRTLCFIEVKTRTSLDYGAPQESVTPAKQRQLSRLANAYISYNRHAEVPCRFDVVEVMLPARGTALAHTAPHIALLQDAFPYRPAGGRGPRVF